MMTQAQIVYLRHAASNKRIIFPHCISRNGDHVMAMALLTLYFSNGIKISLHRVYFFNHPVLAPRPGMAAASSAENS